MEFSCTKGSRVSSELSGLVFTKNILTAKLAAEKRAKDNAGEYDDIKICSVTCRDGKLADYSHIEPKGTINNIEYGF